jgi:3-deoxy-manno-octulosonate cytidylyltransferase (CMP-KDO synthetase)
MIGNKSVTCIIPARLKSTRFPRKMLSFLGGKPLLQWAWEAATSTAVFDSVAIATDDMEIAELIKNFGGTVYLTSPQCLNGTERLIELQSKGIVDADIWVCWQGDEPFIKEQTINDLLQTAGTDGSDVWTLKERIMHKADVESPHIVQVVSDLQGYALYFSRHSIPYYRDQIAEDEKVFYKHVGIYAYARAALKKIATLPASPLELAEQLEQLRFLEGGLKVRVHETKHQGIGIDLPEHLVLAEQVLAKTGSLT